MTRILDFNKIKNIRDLGTLKNVDGKVIKDGYLVRSANPCLASQKDFKLLKSRKFDAVIDFRDNREKTPAEAPFRVLFPCTAYPITAGNLTPDGYIALLQKSSPADMKHMMQELYAMFPVRFKHQFQSFLQHAEEGKKILFHCTAGKDRTGFASALLLSALDVPYESIMEDFLLSNQYFAEVAQKMYEELEKANVDPDVARPLLSVEPSYLENAFNVIRAEFGSMNTFLNDVLKIDCTKLQKKYLIA